MTDEEALKAGLVGAAAVIRNRALRGAIAIATDVARDVGPGAEQAGARRACDEIVRRITAALETIDVERTQERIEGR